MDAKITVRFFQISLSEANAARPDTILRRLNDVELVKREFELDENIILRLERLEPEPNFLSGEFCRIQNTNIPPSAGPDGLTPTILEEGKGLGHLAAFRYHVPTRILLLQMNQQCATARRISIYLGAAEGRPLYLLEPVLRQDVLARIGKAEVRAFKVKFAEPQNMEALDDAALSALQGAKRAAEILHAHEIEIRIAAGPKKKKQKRPHMLQQPVRRILTKLSKSDHVEILQAKISEDDEAKWIDLLEEQIKHCEVYKLPSDDTERNYTIRKNYLIRIFNDNIAALKKLYGPEHGDN